MTEHNKLEATFARAHAQPAARRKTTLRSAALLGASLIGLMAAVPAHADETSDLRAQIDALSRRLAAMESREKAAAAAKPPKPTAAPVVAAAPAAPSPEVITLNQRVTKLETAAATPSAIAPGTPAGLTTNQNGNMLGFLNNPVMLYDDHNTSVHLYGLLEATLSDATNQNAKGSSSTGFQTAWFSGNRWGIDADHLLDFGDSIGLPGLKIISKLESEFELPTGAMDTPNVLFNRDAWLGVYSPDLGKLTVGRQNTLTRDFTANWGDAYGSAQVGLQEGGFTNVNNFKQFIFYSGDNTSTRNNSAVNWKKQIGEHWVVGAGYGFNQSGTGGSSAAAGGGAPGQFAVGASEAVSVAYNKLEIGSGALNFNVNFNHANLNGLNHQDILVGGNYVIGPFRVNAGFVHFTAEQGVNNAAGTRTDDSWTVSGSVLVTPKTELDLGYVEMSGRHAGFGGSGNTLNPFQDTSAVTKTANGSKGTIFGSAIFHADKQTDFYIASDYMKVQGGWSVGDAQGNAAGFGAGRPHSDELEVATGVRFKF